MYATSAHLIMADAQDCMQRADTTHDGETEEEVCAICCDDISGEATSSLECGHAFHTRCVLTHLQRLGSFCPLCRNDPRTCPSNLVEQESDEGDDASSVDEADVFEEIMNDTTMSDELRRRPEFRHHFRTLDRWTAVSANLAGLCAA